MSKYIFYEGQPANNFTPAFERFLFNEERHLHSQVIDEWNTFSWLDESTQKIAAQIHFYIENGVALCPYKAPFGSVELAEGLQAESLHFFLMECEKNMKQKGVKKILIKDAPHIYRIEQSATLTVLLQVLGYQIVSSEINAAIIVDNTSWETKISKDELYHLRRCYREQLIFKSIELTKLNEVYHFIERCRHERGVSLSMTLGQLKDTIEKCPKDFLLFGVYQNEELIAGSICIKINDRILYDFYYGHSKSSNHLSPVVFLLDGQYTFCKENGFQLLDLGTSSVGNKINHSLLNFKSQVGGTLSLKLAFEKKL